MEILIGVAVFHFHGLVGYRRWRVYREGWGLFGNWYAGTIVLLSLLTAAWQSAWYSRRWSNYRSKGDQTERAVRLHRSATHDAPEDALSILQLCNAIFQEMSLALGARRLRGDCLHFGICHAAGSDRGENILQATDDVPLYHLRRDVCHECFLRYLYGSNVSLRRLQ